MNRAAASVAALLLLSACGADAKDVVAETADNLERLRSGIIELRFSTVVPSGQGTATPAGFELTGSFQFSEEGELPVADLRYADLGTEDGVTQRFISTGDAVFIEEGGQAYELTMEQTDSFRGDAAEAQSLFGRSSVSEWIEDPELSEGEGLDGEEVHRITGQLEAVAAFNDLLSMVQTFGGEAGLGSIEGVEAERLEKAVSKSHIEVITGTEDSLLRRLLLEVELALEEEPELAEILGPLAASSFSLDLSISGHNQPIEVSAPRDAMPIEELAPVE